MGRVGEESQKRKSDKKKKINEEKVTGARKGGKVAKDCVFPVLKIKFPNKYWKRAVGTPFLSHFLFGGSKLVFSIHFGKEEVDSPI